MWGRILNMFCNEKIKKEKNKNKKRKERK